MRRVAKGLVTSIAIVVIVFWSLFPILIVIVSSFKLDRDVFLPERLVDFEPTLANYQNLLSRWPEFFTGLLNSLIVTAGAVGLAVAVSTLAGYAMSRYRTRFQSGSALFLIVVRLIPPIVITLPLFPVVNALNLNDTHILLIVLYATFFVSMGALVMRTFIDQIPQDLDEAAEIDGASKVQIIRRVILPLAVQGMVAVAVFVTVYSWNEYLFAFIFTTRDARTAPIVLSEMMGALDGIQWGVLFAASTLQLLPVLVFILLVQRFLVAGLTAGAVKG